MHLLHSAMLSLRSAMYSLRALEYSLLSGGTGLHGFAETRTVLSAQMNEDVGAADEEK
jgi:hypothetical protein